MNVFGKTSRSWRTNKKRAVSPIIATILLVAITVVLAAVLYVLISGLTGGGNSKPLGTAFALGTPAESTVATAPTGMTCSSTSPAVCYTYSFTIESAGGGITWNSINFQVKNSAGTVQTVTAYAVWGIGGPQAALSSGIAYATGSTVATWSGTPTTGVSTVQTLILYVAGTNSATDPLGGSTLYALGVSGYQGTVQVTIP